MWICWAWSWEVTEEISHLLLLCHRAGSTDVPSSMMPLRFPVSTCQTMGARQSAMLHWGWSQVRSKRHEQNSSRGWSCALRVLGYWLGMTDPSLSSNLKVGLVTGSPPVPSFLHCRVPTVVPFELCLISVESAVLWRKSWNSRFAVPGLHHALRFPILFASSFWD